VAREVWRGSLILFVGDDSLESIAEDLADDMWPKIEYRLRFEAWADHQPTEGEA